MLKENKQEPTVAEQISLDDLWVEMLRLKAWRIKMENIMSAMWRRMKHSTVDLQEKLTLTAKFLWITKVWKHLERAMNNHLHWVKGAWGGDEEMKLTSDVADATGNSSQAGTIACTKSSRTPKKEKLHSEILPQLIWNGNQSYYWLLLPKVT